MNKKYPYFACQCEPVLKDQLSFKTSFGLHQGVVVMTDFTVLVSGPACLKKNEGRW